MACNAMERGRNKGHKKKLVRIGQYVSTRFYLLSDWECHIENYNGRILSSCMWILVHKHMGSRRNVSFSKIYKNSLSESNLWKKITGFGFAKGPRFNQAGRQPISWNNDAHSDWWQRTLTRKYIKISVHVASMICGLVSQVNNKWFGCCYL